MTTFSVAIPLAIYTSMSFFTGFDRSTKVSMFCMNHPENKYMSKDPFSSQIFARGDIGWGRADCDCKLNCLAVYDNGDGDTLSEHQTHEDVFPHLFKGDMIFAMEARGWVLDCTEDEDAEYSMTQCANYIRSNYDGGLAEFIKNTCNW